jgi:hypothetical protein
MKDLIIGCSTNYGWDQLKYWVNSINQSGFDGEKTLIALNISYDAVDKLSKNGFQVVVIGKEDHAKKQYVYESRIPVHVERFVHIYNHILRGEYRYIVTTDVKDVVFQSNPCKWLDENLVEGKNLVFASESMKYKDEPWGNQNLLETYGQFIYERFKNNEIHNVGVLGGRALAMRDLCLNIFAAALGRPIPICDQSTFNFMISQHPYTDTSMYMKSEDGWASQLGTTGDPTKIEQFRPKLLEPIPKFNGKKVTTSKGKEFCIVHQYDRVPTVKKLLEKTYG